MKFKDLYIINEMTTVNKPSKLVEDLLQFQDGKSNIYEFVKRFEFDSLKELRDAIDDAHYIICNDKCLTRADSKTDTEQVLLRKRAMNLYTSPNSDSKILAKAEELWLSHFEPMKLRFAREKLLDVTRSKPEAEECAKRIMDVYGFSANDLEKFRYYICQCRRDNSDPLLNRALYLFSKSKMTGKTTVANIISGVLNGCKSWGEVERGRWQSSIAQELQFGTFDKPKGCKYYSVVMDEAFTGKSTKSYYGKFKNSITSDSCTVEVKFGGKYDVPCRRNYIFTSNNDVSSIVADSSERRIMVVTMERRPKSIPYEELFELWKSYIVNVPDEDNVAEWYSATMDNVVGEDGRIEDDVRSALLSEEFELHVKNSPRTSVSFPKFFVDYINSRDSSRHNIEIIKRVVLEVFGLFHESSGRKYYNISELNKVILSANNRDIYCNERDVEQLDELPF